MKKTSHPIDELELMAYLDSELPRDRAASAAAHLEGCRECQEMAAEIRRVSQRLVRWEVSPTQSEITPAISSALEEHRRKIESTPRRPQRNLRELFGNPTRRGVIGAVAVMAVAILLIISVSVPNYLRSPGPRQKFYDGSNPSSSANSQRRPDDNYDGQPHSDPNKSLAADKNGSLVGYDSLGRLESRAGVSPSPAPPPPPPRPTRGQATGGKLQADQSKLPHGQAEGPMVVRTANLAIATRDFDHARAGLEEILKRYHGYFGQLTVSGAAGSGRTLAATVRVPADKLDATISDLKGLGMVQSESQNGEEVTQQYVDLEARLLNARHTEQRLSDLLRDRTGRLSDVLEVEQEIDRVRGDIEQMDAEKRELSKRVSFATIEAQLKEDYKAELQIVPTSTSTRLRNAAVEGYETMVAGLINLGLFLASWGPTLLLWGALLFVAARIAWKRYRQRDLV